MELEDLKFHLDRFEGPLDLLLHLISKNKVSICDIPISLIFDQYMEYIKAWQSMDMDIAGEFIAMASELMLIKSRMLLPKPPPPDDVDPRERLAAALAEYQKAKETAFILGERYKLYHGRILKEPEDIKPEIELTGHDVAMLSEAFNRIVKRARSNGELLSEKPQEFTLGNLLSYRVISLPGKIIGIMRTMYKTGDISFEKLLLSSVTRGELVTSFIAVLELLRSQRLSIIQENEDDALDIILRLDKTSHHKTSVSDLNDY